MYLYKFSNVETNKLACLASYTIWFAKPSYCNDPFEGVHNIKNIVPEEFTYVKKIIKEAIMPIEIIDQITPDMVQKETDKNVHELTKCSILSLSEDSSKIPIYLNNLMWAHYGAALSGYCLKFKKKEFISSIYKIKLPNNTTQTEWFYPINYAENRPEYDWHKFKSNDTSFIFGHKSLHWSYEQEFRLVSRQEGRHSYDPKSLECIFLGERMSSSQKLLISEIIRAKYKDAKIMVVKRKHDSYELEAIEYEDEDAEDLKIPLTPADRVDIFMCNFNKNSPIK